MANHEAQKNTVLLKTFKTLNFFFTLETFVVNYTLTIIFICHFERCKRGNSHYNRNKIRLEKITENFIGVKQSCSR